MISFSTDLGVKESQTLSAFNPFLLPFFAASSQLWFSGSVSFWFARPCARTSRARCLNLCSTAWARHSAPSSLRPRSAATRSHAVTICFNFSSRPPPQLHALSQGLMLCFSTQDHKPESLTCDTTADLLPFAFEDPCAHLLTNYSPVFARPFTTPWVLSLLSSLLAASAHSLWTLWFALSSTRAYLQTFQVTAPCPAVRPGRSKSPQSCYSPGCSLAPVELLCRVESISISCFYDFPPSSFAVRSSTNWYLALVYPLCQLYFVCPVGSR